MDSLPADILKELMLLLPYSSIVSLGSVNKLFYTVSLTQDIWRTMLAKHNCSVSSQDYRELYKKYAFSGTFSRSARKDIVKVVTGAGYYSVLTAMGECWYISPHEEHLLYTGVQDIIMDRHYSPVGMLTTENKFVMGYITSLCKKKVYDIVGIKQLIYLTLVARGKWKLIYLTFKGQLIELQFPKGPTRVLHIDAVAASFCRGSLISIHEDGTVWTYEGTEWTGGCALQCVIDSKTLCVLQCVIACKTLCVLTKDHCVLVKTARNIWEEIATDITMISCWEQSLLMLSRDNLLTSYNVFSEKITLVSDNVLCVNKVIPSDLYLNCV